MNNNKLVFFILIALSIIFTGYIGWKLSERMQINPWVAKVPLALIVTAVLWGLYRHMGVCPETKEKFHFEVTPAKQCGRNGPYMWSSSSPEKQDFCNGLLDSGEINKYSCGTPALTGLKYIGPNFSHVSNDNWENEYCLPCSATNFYDPEQNKDLGRPPVL